MAKCVIQANALTCSSTNVSICLGCRNGKQECEDEGVVSSKASGSKTDGKAQRCRVTATRKQK
ncbi:Hypothetical predicted protein [Podarcis lilfordi]|uniref:Uncharacterized protein n=1 Tax=Podarcis lilfordi TaxID=74358 RepID=A0AA35KII9_9SAUR|nr:Hypothetical predicted protein [Podarcis lilfordi]